MTYSHPLIESTFAAARNFLREARRQEEWALGYALQQYLGGHVGRTARRLFALHDRKRTDALVRAQDWCTEDTIPPQTARTA